MQNKVDDSIQMTAIFHLKSVNNLKLGNKRTGAVP
jgi:hypothetical protein